MTATMTITAGNSLQTTPNAAVPQSKIAKTRDSTLPGSAIDIASALEVDTAVQVAGTMEVNFNAKGGGPTLTTKAADEP